MQTWCGCYLQELSEKHGLQKQVRLQKRWLSQRLPRVDSRLFGVHVLGRDGDQMRRKGRLQTRQESRCRLLGSGLYASKLKTQEKK
jgi:hypothetical protein